MGYSGPPETVTAVRVFQTARLYVGRFALWYMEPQLPYCTRGYIKNATEDNLFLSGASGGTFPTITAHN